MGTNYDEVAPNYDQRYQRHGYTGLTAALLQFVDPAPRRVLEVGCGTGHWLALLRASGHQVTGIDASPHMLAKAQAKLPAAKLGHARAEALPFPADHFDRVFMINALHHFVDPQRAVREARRVLSTAGELLIIGMDPSTGQDSWSIYDYFLSTRERDLARFPATSTLRSWAEQAGFARCHSFVAERIELRLPAEAALSSGALARHATSQLTELSDAEYAEGLAAIKAANAAAAARGETLYLHSKLHLFATSLHLR